LSQAAVPTQYLSAKPRRFWIKRDWIVTIGITRAKHRRDSIRVIGTSPLQSPAVRRLRREKSNRGDRDSRTLRIGRFEKREPAAVIGAGGGL
jgi:hypothetical protein